MKTKFVLSTVVMILLVFGSGVLAQESVTPRVLSGTVTNIDWQRQQFGVQNKFGTTFLKWNQQTQFNPAGFRDRLKEGTPVFVYFSEGRGNLIASRIELNWTGFGLKGLQYPFDCGPSVC